MPRIVPSVVLLSFAYTVGFALDGQPVLDSPIKTYLAGALVIVAELGGRAFWWWKCRRPQLPRVGMEQLLWVDGRVCTTRMRQHNSHGHMPKALRRCARSQDVPKRNG